jgi:hypothetical protein
LRFIARAKANNSSLTVASLHKLVEGLQLTPNAPPSHDLPMRNKTWQLTILSRMMKELQNGTATYIHNGPEGILVGLPTSTMVLKVFWLDLEWKEQHYNHPLSRYHGPGG